MVIRNNAHLLQSSIYDTSQSSGDVNSVDSKTFADKLFENMKTYVILRYGHLERNLQKQARNPLVEADPGALLLGFRGLFRDRAYFAKAIESISQHR